MANTLLRLRERRRNRLSRRCNTFLMLAMIPGPVQRVLRRVPRLHLLLIMLVNLGAIVRVKYPLYSNGRRFYLAALTDMDCRNMFRFDRLTLLRIAAHLALPERHQSPWGSTSSGEESFCIFLYYLAHRCTLVNLRARFGFHSPSHFSFVVRDVARRI